MLGAVPGLIGIQPTGWSGRVGCRMAVAEH
jgi:hypothetical protein